MKERPILFSGEMVRAILEGRKTQTRRVVKKIDQKCDGLKFIRKNEYAMIWNKNPEVEKKYVPKGGLLEIAHIHCPFGQPGDQLWVRETWAHDDPDCQNIHCENIDHIWWKANEIKLVADSFCGSARWHPSIHMPRWASRILLEVVSIRVERVQEIDMNGIIAEGIHESYVATVESGIINPPLHAFRKLWDSINEKRGYSWEVNPWVWVVEFKRIDEEIAYDR